MSKILYINPLFAKNVSMIDFKRLGDFGGSLLPTDPRWSTITKADLVYTDTFDLGQMTDEYGQPLYYHDPLGYDLHCFLAQHKSDTLNPLNDIIQPYDTIVFLSLFHLLGDLRFSVDIQDQLRRKKINIYTWLEEFFFDFASDDPSDRQKTRSQISVLEKSRHFFDLKERLDHNYRFEARQKAEGKSVKRQ